MSNLIQLGPQYFPKSSIGTPIGAGKLYIGDVDTDPTVTANQKTVQALEENGTFTTLSQPITLSAGGIPLNNGSPVALYTNGDYSMTVQDVNSSQIYYVPSTSITLSPGNFFYPDATETDQGVAGSGGTVNTYVDAIGATNKATIYFRHNGGGEYTDYTFSTSETITSNITLIFEMGARLDIDAGKTVTVQGLIDTGPNLITTGSGTFTYSYAIGLSYGDWDGSSNEINLLKGQFNFPDTQNSSSDVNTLDDYEQGTFTSGVSFGGGTTGITYTTQKGFYVKIGHLVIVGGYFTLSDKGSSNGDAKITGLPFIQINSSDGLAAVTLRLNKVTFADAPQAITDQNLTTISLFEVTNAGVQTTLADGNFANDSHLTFSVSYTTTT